MSRIGEKIKARRESLGLSQNGLAKAAGIAQATLSAIETSTKSPSVDTILQLAGALRCPVSFLLGEGDAEDLPADEQELLSMFRQLNAAGRAALLAAAEGMLSTPGLRQAASIASMG